MSLSGEMTPPPTGAFALSLTGGVIILLSEIELGLSFVTQISHVLQFLPFPALGLLIVVGSFAARANPSRRPRWGTIIIVSSAVILFHSILWLYYAPAWGAILIGGVVLGLAGGVGWIRDHPRFAAGGPADP